MSPTSWQIPDRDPRPGVEAPPTPVASLQYLRSALVRRWRLWSVLAVLGLALGVVYPVLRPPPSIGTTTLVLAHQQDVDPALAMATDVSFLRTRTVAAGVIDRLDLDATPEGLQAAILVEPLTSDVLVLSVAAEDAAAAVERVAAVTEVYLAFRAEQVRAESEALMEGNELRIADLEKEIEQLTRQFDALAVAGPDAQDRIGDVLTQRSQAIAQVNELQQANEASELEASTVNTATRVVDEPSVVPTSPIRTRALPALSGLIGGLGLGVGLVLFGALTSTRLRTRAEIALAVGAPVRYSVGAIRGPRPWAGRLRRGASPGRDLDVLCRGLAEACPAGDGGPVRLAVGTLDNARDVELVVGTLGARLSLEGRSVLLVDLSDRGRLERAVSRALAREGRQGSPTAAPVVFRPGGVPSLARGPLGREVSAPDVITDAPARAAWENADVVLTLVEVEPSVGVDDLASWADRMVLVVTAGRSSAERLRTTGELVRSAGLALLFQLLVGADRSDESLGVPEVSDAPTTSFRTATR